MLTPKGRTLAELRAFRLERPGGTEVLLDLPREALAGTREHLRRFVPPMFARWADASAEMGAVGVYGPRSRGLVTRTLAAEVPPLDEDAWVEAQFEGAQVVVVGTRAVGGEEGLDLLAPAAVLPALWRALLAHGEEVGARPVGWEALEALRVEAGVPRYGAELTEDIIPTEAFEAIGMMPRAISFTKGCYTGQEVIVRIAHRGHVNRHLRGLRLGAAAPAAGTPLFHPDTGREVGRITSTAFSPLLGETVALGYVRRELGPGDAVRVGAADGERAWIVELPFRGEVDDAG
jgi:folate-binding protein YgfZ